MPELPACLYLAAIEADVFRWFQMQSLYHDVSLTSQPSWDQIVLEN